MRTLLCLVVLALPSAAAAEPQPVPRERAPVRPLLDERFTEAAQRQAEESAARQNEFDRRIAERSARAARSICSGCGSAGTGSAGRVTPPGTRRANARESAEVGLPHDPAQAPLD
ncbi:hypothetical protein HNR00_004679 [Methylorubrum rhodinum]|uniref:Uncharacterized protein n=1 Tax=Methylorubrum rhodinum TaxID=29428 RepID=A0A840ZNW9_9HYPH|nr:hypothetical protein [Methylorubrum rhodinum]MBB5759942.1 hypothetical protein [Methylorubrum rhodinum]